MTKIYLLVCLLFAMLNGLVSSSSSSSVTELNIDTFDYFIEENEFAMVMFYSPWCQHCKKFAPEFNKMAKKLIKQKSSIKVAKVNSAEQTILSERYDVVGYPTMIFFIRGKPFEYRSGRAPEAIMQWMKNKITPPQELATVDEAEEFIDNSTVTVIGFFKNRESAAAKIYNDIVMEDDAHQFGITSADEVFANHEAEDDSIILFKTYDERKAVLKKEELTEANLKIFLKEKALPILIDFTMDTASLIFDKHFKNHLLMFVSRKENQLPDDMDKLREMAKKYRDRILFVAVDMDEREHHQVLNVFGMRMEEMPTMRIVNFDNEMIKHRPENDEITLENIEQFVQQFLDGKIEPDLLAQELPDDWNAHPVKVLVKSNFYEIVYDTEKDVLVEFYSPDCGHCKNLEPIYDELGEIYKNKKHIVIAKIDATKNEMPEAKIMSFPTIRLYRKGNNEMVDFQELRTIPKFMEFIEGINLSEDADNKKENTSAKDEL